MPSVDETLRHAFAERDEQWVGRTEPALAAVRARHRRQQVVRRTVAVAALGGVAAAAVLALGGPPAPSRTQEPVAPPTSSSAPPTAAATPLDGTWTSRVLHASDVHAAARASGSPAAATYMLDQLGDEPFRLHLLVESGTLSTSIEPVGGAEEPLDQETLEVDGETVTLAPLTFEWESQHRWSVDGDRLRMRFVSTTETMTGGVPGEAWQRLLYDTAVYTRAQ